MYVVYIELMHVELYRYTYSSLAVALRVSTVVKIQTRIITTTTTPNLLVTTTTTVVDLVRWKSVYHCHY